MSRMTELNEMLKDIQEQIEVEKRREFSAKHPVKAELMRLQEQRNEYLEKHNEKVKAVKAKCKHDYKHTVVELDNYDRDVYVSYDCTECNDTLTPIEYMTRYGKTLKG